MGVGRPRVKMWMARTGNNERAAELGDTLHNGCFLGRGRRREEERRRGGEEDVELSLWPLEWTSAECNWP